MEFFLVYNTIEVLDKDVNKGNKMGTNRAFVNLGIIQPQETNENDISQVLRIILDGFAEASRPVPHRVPPKDKHGEYLPSNTILNPKRVFKKMCVPPANLNRNNPDRILRIFMFNDNPLDIFVEVNQKKMARPKYWEEVRSKLAKEPQPVYLRVDFARKVNGHIRENHPFYTHVLSDGILLYEIGCNIWTNDPAPITSTKADTALKHMEEFQQEIKDWKVKQKKAWQKEDAGRKANEARPENEQTPVSYRRSGFALRHTMELAYHMILTIHIGHSYPETDISFLRKRAEALFPDLRQAWFYRDEIYEAEFEILRHAHKDTHESRQYKISEEEIKTLTYRQKTLLKMANNLCQKKINNL